jgi:putative ABC transport system permease protein
MSGAADISYYALGLSLILLIFPLGISALLRLGIVKSWLYSVARMSVQLLLVGFFLKFIFDYNRPLINIAWVLVMIIVATGTIIYRSNLRMSMLLLPAFISVFSVTAGVLFYFNGVIVGLDNLFEARYFIAVGGMLLGNSLRGNIVGLTSFYTQIKRNETRFQYSLANGATLLEAVAPYLRDSLKQAFSPLIATMVTTGIVALPGMMTGQILGGSSPLVAVKYQIAIMVAIAVALTMSTALTILMTLRVSFSDTGTLRNAVFQRRKKN